MSNQPAEVAFIVILERYNHSAHPKLTRQSLQVRIMILYMNFTSTVREILSEASEPLTPQIIRERIKADYAQHYGTESHRRNVAKGHYKDLDHALLAQIYLSVRNSKHFYYDNRTKPARVSLAPPDQATGPTRNSEAIAPLRTQKLRQKPHLQTLTEATTNEDALIRRLDHYYEQSLRVMQDFGGPSIYFHIQALRAQRTDFLSDRHLEMTYATLASWGMHRMGDPRKTKAKLVNFDDFRRSILNHQMLLADMVDYRMENCEAAEYEDYLDSLKEVYCALRISISDATVVAHAKTLAHILPNLVPPIDRQYTVRFFTQQYQNFFTSRGTIRGVANLPPGTTEQFAVFKEYSLRIKALLDRADCSSIVINENSFNTSYPKIMDNLIMAFVKEATNSVK